MSGFFNWCEAEGLLNGHEPMRNVEKPGAEGKGTTVLSDEEVDGFLRLLDKRSPHKKTPHVAFGLM